MPELPEVETTRLGILPHVENRRVTAVVVRQRAMRWPVPDELEAVLTGARISTVERRGKYLLLHTARGVVLVHLGMSGSLRIVEKDAVLRKHDHVDICLQGSKVLRFHDPRRFGCVLWQAANTGEHPLLALLGPEPLSGEFTAEYLFARSRKRKVPVKHFIMDSHVVVGVGNIYANEALFSAGILPKRRAGSISLDRYRALVAEIKTVLARAITVGGTTLRDFIGGDGKPGYFKQSLQVYGRGGEPCIVCQTALKEVRLGQRTTVFCPQCQH